MLQRLKRINPEVMAVVFSGYFNDSILSEYQSYGFRGMIPIPTKPQDMDIELRRILTRSLQEKTMSPEAGD